MKLQINEQSVIDVDPAQRYQITNIDVSPGEQYQFEAKGTWQDASQPCGPDGWHNWWTGYVLRFSRLPSYDLFFLGGNIGCDEKTNFPIGSSTTKTIDVAGQLFLFANDLWYFYGNNHRIPTQPMLVKISRIA
jgi:hypothetical protein